jgi:putative oxidoreductase
MAALCETISGVLLAAGFATPAAVAIVASVMLGCYGDRAPRQGLLRAKRRIRVCLVLAAAALTLAFTGPGSLSFDALAGLPRGGTIWGIGALVAGLLGGGAALLEWRKAPLQQTANTK